MDPEDDTARQAAASLKQELRRRLTASLRANRQASRETSLDSIQALMDSLGSEGIGHGNAGASSSNSEVVDIASIRTALAVYGDVLARIEAVVGQESGLGPEGMCCEFGVVILLDNVRMFASIYL